MHARSSNALDIEPLANDDVVWGAVAEATYVLHQRYRYDYPGPIADLHHRLLVIPRPMHGDQRRIASRLDVSPHAVTHDGFDAFANPVATVFLRRVEQAIEFAHWSIVTRISGVQHRVEHDVRNDPALHEPTMLTACDADLRAVAKSLRAQHHDERLLAEAINAFVHAHIRYAFGSTDVETSAARAYALRRGVCQDSAHVMLAIARRCGLAARYVSGHLVGEGGTHAWVEVLVADGIDSLVLPFDPTHGCRADMRYITIAVGRDYADVAPTSGVYTAAYQGTMTASKRVGATRVRYIT